jgi:RNA polymerase sigma-70 factor (ECF subfamily)
MSLSDQKSIKLCLNGHPEEYRQLVLRYEAAVLSFLAGRLGNREGAEEASQETFVRAYFSLRDLKKPDSFFSWILGIAARVAQEQHRTLTRHKPLVEDPPAAPPPSEMKQDIALEQAVADLPPPYRETVLLRYYGGLSCEETAEKLQVALGTITKRLSRAYKLLRSSLSERDHEDRHLEVQP